MQALTAYLVPVLAALLSLWALFFLPPEYPDGDGRPLAFQAMTIDGPRTPDQALAVLRQQPQRTTWDTHLSEHPLWLLIPLDPAGQTADTVVDFPSRHAMSMRYAHARHGW